MKNMKATRPTKWKLGTFITTLVKVTLFNDVVIYGNLIKCDAYYNRNFYELSNQRGHSGKVVFRVSHIKKIEGITLDEYKSIEGEIIK